MTGGAAAGLSSERSYVRRVLPTAVAREVRSMTATGWPGQRPSAWGGWPQRRWLRQGQGQPNPVPEAP